MGWRRSHTVQLQCKQDGDLVKFKFHGHSSPSFLTGGIVAALVAAPPGEPQQRHGDGEEAAPPRCGKGCALPHRLASV